MNTLMDINGNYDDKNYYWVNDEYIEDINVTMTKTITG